MIPDRAGAPRGRFFARASRMGDRCGRLVSGRVAISFAAILCAVGAITIWTGPSSWAADDLSYEPLSAYDQREIGGWTCWVNHRLTQHSLGEPTIRLLQAKLYDICCVVPTPALDKLRAIPIWVELDDDKQNPCCCYHISREWLGAHGFNPDKAKSVEICNAGRFIDWSRQQPTMILHELAHGYHDRELGYDEPRIRAAYQQAKESGRYERVLRGTGGTQRHYALTNPMEYFAEATEAYFGVNDFFPFVHAELREFDPEGFRLLQTIWGQRPGYPGIEPPRRDTDGS